MNKMLITLSLLLCLPTHALSLKHSPAQQAVENIEEKKDKKVSKMPATTLYYAAALLSSFTAGLSTLSLYHSARFYSLNKNAEEIEVTRTNDDGTVDKIERYKIDFQVNQNNKLDSIEILATKKIIDNIQSQKNMIYVWTILSALSLAQLGYCTKKLFEKTDLEKEETKVKHA